MPNLNRRSIRHQFPNLIHLGIRKRDAAIRPVGELLPGFDPFVSGRQAMDHDVATWVDAELAGAFAVGRVGIGNVQSQMAAAVRVPAVDGVVAFGSFVVALLLLRIASCAAA